MRVMFTDKVAGIRHVGMVGLLDGAVETIRHRVTYLGLLRQERGTPLKKGSMEYMAQRTVSLYDGGRPHLMAILREEVDMTNDFAREAWVIRKDSILGQLLGGLFRELSELEEKRICRKEMRKVKGAWIESWSKYADMTGQELVAAGWMERKEVGGSLPAL